MIDTEYADTQHAVEMAQAIHETIVDNFVEDDEWVVEVDGNSIFVHER